MKALQKRHASNLSNSAIYLSVQLEIASSVQYHLQRPQPTKVIKIFRQNTKKSNFIWIIFIKWMVQMRETTTSTYQSDVKRYLDLRVNFWNHITLFRTVFQSPFRSFLKFLNMLRKIE